MTGRVLDILVVERDQELAHRITSALQRRGHRARSAACAEAALVLPVPEVLVSNVTLEGLSGFELLECLRGEDSCPRTVFTAREPDFELCRRSMLLGASDLLAHPLDLVELVRAVEGGLDEEAQRSSRFERDLPAQLDEVERAVRELCAFLMRNGVQPTARARAAGACAELLDNVLEYAYGTGACERSDGRFRLSAALEDGTLDVTIADDGCGIESTGFDGAGPAPEGGIARAASLAEDLRLQSHPARGTRVALRFSVRGAAFDDAEEIDLSEQDYLTPGLARRVVADLLDPEVEPHYVLSPALAVVIGRLLAAAPRGEDARTALWS